MLTRALAALRRAATGTGTVTVRRGHLRWLLAEYERAVGVTVPAHIRAERGCMGCAHDGGGSDCDACEYPEWPHWEPRAEHTEDGMKWTASMGYRRFPDLPLDPPDVAGREDHDPPEDREDDSTPIHPEQDEA